MMARCPVCKKQVIAIKINFEGIQPEIFDESDRIQILGCSECNNIFYHMNVRRYYRGKTSYKSFNKEFKT